MHREIERKHEYLLEWTGERVIPEAGRYMFRRHLMAYQFALPFCRDKAVLDAGCGEGYGSCLLAEAGSTVAGIDISEAAVRHAGEKYVRENLVYQTMDVTRLAFPDNSFDVVVSFQVIEHLHDAGKFLEEVRRVLKNDGRAIISTPVKAPVSDQSPGKYHVREYCCNEFMDLLDAHFENVEYYGIHLKEQKDVARLRLMDLLPKLDVFKIRKLFPAFRKQVMTAIEKTVALDISSSNLDVALDIIGVGANNRRTRELKNGESS